MPIPVTVPRLGWNMDEGTFVEWLKADGDAVRHGEMLFRLEGEKAVEEIECFDAGTLSVPPDGPKPGDRVKVEETRDDRGIISLGERRVTPKDALTERPMEERPLSAAAKCISGMTPCMAAC